MVKATASRILLLTWAFTLVLAAATGASAQSPLDGPPFSADPPELLKAAAAVPVPEGEDVVVLREENHFRMESDGRTRWVSHLVYKIANQAGAEDWDSLRAEWAPWHQRRPVVRARVVTPDGTAHELDLSTLVESSLGLSDGKVYSDRMQIQGPLPAVAAGAVVEWTVEIEEEAPFFPGGVVRHILFGNRVPTEFTRLSLDLPVGMPFRYEVRSLEGMVPSRSEQDGRVRLEFVRGHMDALEEFEELVPSDVRQWPVVAFSNGESWQSVAAAYGASVDPLVAAEPVKGLVSKALGRRKGRQERAAALLDWIHEEIRYTGVEFGASGLVPAPVPEILKRKYGDCKEQALLLVSMLKAAGVEAHLALLRTGPGEDSFPDLPGMGVFNHAIVYVPPAGGEDGLWIDPSLDYSRPGELSASSQDRLALVIAGGTAALVRTPTSSSQDNLYEETREYHLAEEGGARIVETTAVRGETERAYRNYYTQTSAKDVREQLEKYAKDAYGAKKVGEITFSPPRDLDAPFQLRLEVSEADHAKTDTKGATVYIPYGPLFRRLPDLLSTKEESEEEGAAGEGEASEGDEEPAKPRRYDLVLGVPFASQVRCVVIPPPGFRISALPEPVEEKLGPCTFSEAFAPQGDGSLLVTIRFDTVGRRFTPGQQKLVRDGVVRHLEGDALKVTFEQVGEAHLSAAQYREALEEFRALEVLHPKEALHKIQRCRALLAAGLGEAARAEAKAATAVEPESWQAWQNLGWTLQHDLMGRRLFPGFDYNGAVAAYRKAQALAPEEMEVTADLAILFEHDDRGLRYLPGARLDEAVAEYEKIREKTKGTNLANNLPYALLYSERFDALQEFLSKEKPNLTFQCLQVTLAAATEGVEAAKAVAGRLIAQEKDRRAALTTAGSLMMKMRRYQEAAELVVAGAQGQKDAADQLGRAEMIRNSKRAELAPEVPGSPEEAVVRFLRLTELGEEKGGYPGLISRVGMESMDAEKVAATVRRTQYSTTSSARTSGVPPQVLIDMALSTIRPVAEGDDAFGYRVRLPQAYSSNLPKVYYVIKEDGQYKVLGTNEEADIGRWVLALLDRGDLESARRWLDWARDEYRLGGGEDPLAGTVFARFWTKGEPADAAVVRVAAACLITLGPKEEPSVPILEEGLARAESDEERTQYHLALAWVLRDLKRFDAALEHARVLLEAYPRSYTAFRLCGWSLAGLKRWDEAQALVRERLQAMPDDIDTLRFQAYLAMDQGAAGIVREASQRIIELGRPNATDYNRLAWVALFEDPPLDPDTQELARRAVSADNGKSGSVVHTLAAVYADSGKPAEARDLLIKSMKMGSEEEPGPSIWCVMGRIAEAYGQEDAAAAAFGRAVGEETSPFSSSALAKIYMKRAKALKKTKGR